jgi:transcriptional regulator with XRE-family HTH domain
MEHNDQKKQLIASRLAIARKQAGLSQSQVAVLLGLHRPTISEIEAGRRSVTGEELVKLAEIYGTNIEWLAPSGKKQVNIDKDTLELAARELSKLDKKDLQRILGLLNALQTKGKK